MLRSPFVLLLASIALLAASCAKKEQATLPPELDPLVLNRDTTLSPGADFFAYANGGWVKRNPIPDSERSWGIANLVNEETYRQRRVICEEAAAANAAAGTSTQKVGDYWAAAMDSAAIEAQGAAPLKPFLDEIDAVKDRAGLLALVAKLQGQGFNASYGLWVGQDEKNSDRYIVHLVQSGLHLPDRDYYFGTAANTQRVRDAYPTHLTNMFGLLGEPVARAKASASAVMRLETALAASSRTLEERRDPWANYHPMTPADLAALTPAIDWAVQWKGMGVPPQDTVIVGQPEFLHTLDSLVTNAPLADWQAYLRWVVTTEMASHLSRAFDDEDFRFHGTVMSGIPAQRARWKRALDATESAIGELVGQEWVKKHCSPATKERYTRLTKDILAAYRERIQALPWMSAETKKAALSKLDKVGYKVAYPDQWRDYSTLEIRRDSWAANQVRVNTWWFQHEVSKLGKPIDRSEWDMTPQTYNAYYDPSKNEMVLPAAAFMLPGVPDSLVDDAILYAYAGGSTIGHEITHGFDDEGRQFDERGNLNPWWAPEDSAAFTARAQGLVEQFNGYMVGDQHVRGQATLGENLADLGGVRLGLEAFKKTAQYKSGKSINGLTPTQRYFLAYALSWLGHRRPESLAQQIMTDVHAPGFLRVNGPVANFGEFHEAFGVKPGEAMFRSDSLKVVVW
jgi:putative endopeptidase